MKYNSSTDVSLVVSNTFRTSMDALLPFYPGTKQQLFIRLPNCIIATVETFSVSLVNKLSYTNFGSILIRTNHIQVKLFFYLGKHARFGRFNSELER